MTYSPEQREAAIAKVVEGLSDAIPLAVICREADMPSDDSIRDWADADEEISRRIARARDAGWDKLAHDCISIADDTTDEASSRKVRIWTRLELLKRWDPRRYGELLKLAGADGQSKIMDALAVTFVQAKPL